MTDSPTHDDLLSAALVAEQARRIYRETPYWRLLRRHRRFRDWRAAVTRNADRLAAYEKGQYERAKMQEEGITR